jgi:two-component system chemotaxis response regulator CheV
MTQSKVLLESGTNELEVVEFYIDEDDGYRGSYGINVAKVLEIIRMEPITSMPSMHDPCVLGAFKYRDGRIVPLIDLAVYLKKSHAQKEDSKIIVTEFNHVVTAFLVSGVNRIHRLSWQDVESPGEFLQHASSAAVTGVVHLEGRVVFVLDMEKIVADLNPDLVITYTPSPELVDSSIIYNVVHADDSASVRNLVKNLLEGSGGFNVIQKDNGESAWELLLDIKRQAEEQGRPLTDFVDGVITDIEMPSMDGLSLCKRIKSDPVLRALPVALFSSLITERLMHKGESVGADAQFAKPDLSTLSSKLISLISAQKANL